MSWGRLAVAVLLALSLSGTAPGPVLVVPAQAGPLRQVAAGGVAALVPRGWDVRPVASPAALRQGLTALVQRSGTEESGGPDLGLRAYWLDAGRVQVRSDYYYLAARGTGLEPPVGFRGCRNSQVEIIADHRPVLDRSTDSTGDFVAVAGGTCRMGSTRARWASFVAAPGYGPARGLGIPRSGMYYAMVVLPDGPEAREHVHNVLMHVSFGGTPVSTFVEASGLGRER